MKACDDSPVLQTRKLDKVVYISFVQDEASGNIHDDELPSELDKQVKLPTRGLFGRAASTSPSDFVRRIFRSDSKESKDSNCSADKELLSIEMDSVLEVFADPTLLKKLISALEPKDLELSFKAKLVASVMEMSQEGTAVGKRMRERKIAKFFATPGGQFYIPNIPWDIEKRLEKEDFGCLAELKALFLEELIQDKLALSTVFRLCTEDW
jgi:hypothetical protein